MLTSAAPADSLPSRAGRFVRSLRGLLPTLAAALTVRYVGWVIMMALALYGEGRAAPHLPDLIVDRLPYLAWVDRYNHYLLAVAYLPIGVGLFFVAPARFCRYNVSAGLLSIARGICIAATGLGPVRGPDVHADWFAGDRGLSRYLQALWDLCSPTGLLLRDASHLYLTKDLFFSGHTAATFLLLLYVWPYRVLRGLMLVGHGVVVASVFLAKLHYTIDVLGAYAVAYALFALREQRAASRAPA